VRQSFEECDAWLQEATKFGANPTSIPVALCANKIDIKRAVSEEEGRQVSLLYIFVFRIKLLFSFHAES
jgi:GTPase SAR1 family protein